MALYGDDPVMPYQDLAAELATQIRLLRAVLGEQKTHEQAYRKVEPDELARSLSGIAESARRCWSPRWADRSASGRVGSRRSPG